MASHYYEDNTGFVDGFTDDDGYFYLKLIWVHPAMRGEGYAHKLMAHIPRKAKLVVEVVQANGTTPPDESVLQAFYETHGFVMVEPQDLYMMRE